MPTPLLFAIALSIPDPVPQIKEVHRRYSQALIADDQAAMDVVSRDHFRPDFVFYKATGQRLDYWSAFEGSRREAEDRRAGRPDGPVRYDTTFKNWKRNGDRLTVESYSSVVGSWLEGTRRHPVTFQNMVRETWVLTSGKWQALRFEEEWLNGKMDGKPVTLRRK
jgi:hypothetical protein